MLFNRIKSASLFLAVFIITVASLLSFKPLRERLSSSLDFNSFSIRYRLEHWKANTRLILEHPALGVGTSENRKKEVIGPFLDTRSLLKFTKDENKIYNGPHNEYLDVGASVGIIGLLLFLGCLFYPLLNYLVYFRLFDFSLVGILSLCFLIFMYATLIFDKINYTHWPLLIFSWALSFVVLERERGVFGKE
jgi:O-antigen ligase